MESKLIGIIVCVAGAVGIYTLGQIEGDQLIRAALFGATTSCGIITFIMG